ncbi:hypothetical protein Z042_26425 [Chania multitudinisentens RB-25]|uniref:Uncharacterized protein n=1 Tax=Chania multitudinisentens RB-25 TaxID=1441930 RepID=A0A0D4ZYK0_9GAMM|nr:hypothetical protein Z042_26425 [Chania multitudinisentens RB-25]
MGKKTAVSLGWLAIWLAIADNAHRFIVNEAVNGGPVGSPAILTCELGQIRKEAAVASDVCAGM